MQFGSPECFVSASSVANIAADGKQSGGNPRPAQEAFGSHRFLDQIPAAAVLIDQRGRIVASNRSLNDYLDYSPGELYAAPLSILGPDAARLLGSIKEIDGGQSPRLVRLQSRRGEMRACLANACWWSGDPEGARLMCALDCRDQVASEQILGRIAYIDGLTGLPNRAAFLRQLQSRCEAISAGEGAFAVARVDLDRFRLVNDTHGHHTGDGLLERIAKQLRESVNAEAFIARMGGDEFALLMDDRGSERELRDRLERLSQALTGPFDLEQRRIYLTASVGLVRVSDNERSAQEILNNAESALFRAKDEGRNRVTVFAPALQEQARSRLIVFSALQRALRDSELEIHLQPIVEGRSQALVTMEALVRWPDCYEGACQPSQFIPISEELGIAPELDRLVIEESARWLAYLREAHPALRGVPININVSAVTLRNEAIVDLLAAARQQYGLEPEALRVEITETALLSDSEHVQNVLCNLARSGTPLVLDDFGTGYSSLRHVYDLPICALKIDKYFVHRALRDPRSLALVSTILSLARALGISTTAEGIETERQRSTLVRLGCENLQGYLFAKPMPPAELPAWVERMAATLDATGDG